MAIANPDYRLAFKTIVDYVEEANREREDYFPMFCMGKSVQSYVQRNSVMQHTLHDMKNW